MEHDFGSKLKEKSIEIQQLLSQNESLEYELKRGKNIIDEMKAKAEEAEKENFKLI